MAELPPVMVPVSNNDTAPQEVVQEIYSPAIDWSPLSIEAPSPAGRVIFVFLLQTSCFKHCNCLKKCFHYAFSMFVVYVHYYVIGSHYCRTQVARLFLSRIIDCYYYNVSDVASPGAYLSEDGENAGNA